MKFNQTRLLVMVLVLLTGLAKVTWADEDDTTDLITGAKQTDYIKERSYFGVVGTSSTIDQNGDFSGVNSFQFGPTTVVSGGVTTTSNPEVDLIPSITRQFGWGVLLGHREGPWGAEISFWRSDHTSTFIFAGPTTFTTPASYQSINIDFKRYFFTEFPTQPFVSLGISFPWLWVRNGSEILDASQPPPYPIKSVNDEIISGIGLNLGVGFELYLDNNFSLLGGAFQRWTNFDQINGAAKIPISKMYFDNNPADSKGGLAGNGLNLYVGTTFGFE